MKMRYLWTIAAFAAGALALPAAAVPRAQLLPSGTYRYSMSVGGTPLITSAVVITHAHGVMDVTESAGTPTGPILTLRGIVEQTFATTSYSLNGGTGSVGITFAGRSATLTAAGHSITISEIGGAPFLVDENLIAGLATVPAMLKVTGATHLTVACVCRGFLALGASVVPVTESRPANVPAADLSTALELQHQTFTFWYDPETFVPRHIDLPSQHLAIDLQSYGESTAEPSPIPARTPVPLPSPRYASRDVTIVADDGVRLAGTLTMPRSPSRVPAFVLVHGSGCIDRNETIGPNQIFAQIANHLSNEGYAVLRYDKRSCGKSGGTFAVRSRLIADAEDSVRFLRHSAGVDPERIYGLGHSEGGELVPSLTILDERLRGIVLLAPPAIPLDRILLQQSSRGLSGTAKIAAVRNEEAQIALIEAGTIHTPSARWLRSSFGIDPAKILARVPCPILILQGGKDIQVLPTDLPRLVNAARAAHRNVTVGLLQGDDHLFIFIPGTARSTGMEYFIPSYLDPRLFSAIDAWLRTH
ncbi:MAG TPA: alpha/beta fold hydrolase [Candidatus Tyrphobacter sp.]